MNRVAEPNEIAGGAVFLADARGKRRRLDGDKPRAHDINRVVPKKRNLLAASEPLNLGERAQPCKGCRINIAHRRRLQHRARFCEVCLA